MNKLLFVLLVIVCSCSSEQKQHEPNLSVQQENETLSGTMCFKSEDSLNPEFIYIRINNQNSEGEMYTTNEYFGKIRCRFKGISIADSSMEVAVHDLHDNQPKTEKWDYHFDGSRLVFEKAPSQLISSNYILTDCDELPDKSTYGTIEDLESNDHAAYSHHLFPTCYVSVAPNSMRHNGGLFEYLQLKEVVDTIIGFGVGIADGEPVWEFDFRGKTVSDSVYLVQVNYRQEGYAPVTQEEEWKRGNQGGLILKGYNRPERGKEYITINRDDLPKFVQYRFHNQRKRVLVQK